MVRQSYGGALDTPKTNIGDATYLRAPDFGDISQELSFQSPSKDDNILDRLRDGRQGGQIRTPRRDPLMDRQNLPHGIGGAEFTPMLKSATRTSASARRRGKENGANIFNTPGLDRIDENDITALPAMENSMFSSSRNQSYMDHTSLPIVESSSVASTPLAMPRRNGADNGPLQDGNQLSLREQENVIDKIEKENFGLKLKIHFLEEALRKAGPGFSEAALKENTELKVEQVTMQRELQRQKKQLIIKEREFEALRQQATELREQIAGHEQNESLHQELDQLRRELEERDEDIQDLRQKLASERNDNDQLAELQDNIEDLKADLREKEREVTQREDELEELRDKLEEAERNNGNADANDEVREDLDEAKETIQDLEHTIRRLEVEVDEVKDRMKDAVLDKEEAERNLQELQDEMADKSLVTKGLSRQTDDKVSRLQVELEESGKEYAKLETELTEVNNENAELRSTIETLEQAKTSQTQVENVTSGRIQELELALVTQATEKDTLEARNEALDAEVAALQEDIQRLHNEIADLEAAVEQEKAATAEAEDDLQRQYADEIAHLNGEISDLQADLREKDNLYDNDSERWENDKSRLEAERALAEEKAAGLQRTIDRLRQSEGSLSSKGTQLQQAMQSETDRHSREEGILTKQIDDLQEALEARQSLLTTVRNEMSSVRDELRQAQTEHQVQANKIVALETSLETARSAVRPSSSAALTPNRSQLRSATQECEKLREELRVLRAANDTSRLLRGEGYSVLGQRGTLSPSKIRGQLDEANTQLAAVKEAKRSLENDLATVKAERDELNVALKRGSRDAASVDKEQLELRTTKLKAESEVRRLKEENMSLIQQRKSAETALEEEIEKSAEEEDRLNQEIQQLQTKLRLNSSYESTDGASNRRTIRELERRIEDYETRLAAVNTGDVDGELSFIRRDLSAARQKELELLQRESSHRDTVKSLRQEIAGLESRIHNDQIAKVTSRSPAQSSNKTSALMQAMQTEHAELLAELQEQLNDAEDKKIVLEEVLEEARQQAEDTAEDHEREISRLNHELKKMTRERDAVLDAVAASDAAGKERKSRSLQKSQAEIENLEHDVMQQQDMLQHLTETETALRHKLERVRAERGAFRMSAEKLQRQLLQSQSSVEHQRLLTANGQVEEALENVVRASESARERHRMEVKGMVVQMGWMQARWEREAALRADAGFAKGFVQLQLDIANACNKAQLRELEHIRTNLLGNRQSLELTSKDESETRPTLRAFLVMARFVARMKITARQWADQEVVRQKIVTAQKETKRDRRSRRLRVVEVNE